MSIVQQYVIRPFICKGAVLEPISFLTTYKREHATRARNLIFLVIRGRVARGANT